MILPSTMLVVAAVMLSACHSTQRETNGTLGQIKRQQEQRLLLHCVADNGGGVTGGMGLALVKWCRTHTEAAVW